MIAVLALGGQFLASCSPSSTVHRQLYVCIANQTEQSLFNYVTKLTRSLGYEPSTGVATDAEGNVTTVLKASGWTTAVWLTNSVTFPDLNASTGTAEVIPSHKQFSISVDASLPLFRERADRTLAQIRAKLSSAGYGVFTDDGHCSK